MAEAAEADVDNSSAAAADEAMQADEATNHAAAAEAAAEVVGAMETASDPAKERQRIEEQLALLEQKKRELSKALVLADHPALQGPIRMIEGRLYAVSRAETQMAAGLSKAEEKRKESLAKKRETLALKKAELEAKLAEAAEQILAIDKDLLALGDERRDAFEAERTSALEALVVVLSEHNAAFDAVKVDPAAIVEGLAQRMGEVQATAERLAGMAKA
jgi:hypothetical protein